MSKIVDDNKWLAQGMVPLYLAVSDEASMNDVVVVKGWHPVTNDPKVETTSLYVANRKPAWNIQNKTHWCFATAALIMVSGSMEEQDYKYMKPDVKTVLDDYRKKVANDPVKYRDRASAGVRDTTPFGNTAAGIASDDNGRYFYCDSDQEYVATNFAESREVGAETPRKKTNTDNNYNASARDALKEICNQDIVKIVETSMSNKELETWVKGDGSLNYDLIKERLITPLKGGKKVLLDASNFNVHPMEKTTLGHSYIAMGLASDKEKEEVIQVYDPWAGKRLNGGQFQDVSLNNLFKGFWSPIIAGSGQVKTYMTAYFADKAVQKEKPAQEKPKQPFKPDGSRKLRGGAE